MKKTLIMSSLFMTLSIPAFTFTEPVCTTESTVIKDNGQRQIVFSCTSDLPLFRDALWRQPGQVGDLNVEHQEQVERWTNWASSIQNSVEAPIEETPIAEELPSE